MTLTSDLLAGQPLEVPANPVDADAALADDDAGLCGVDDDARLVGAPLDLDLADRAIRSGRRSDQQDRDRAARNQARVIVNTAKPGIIIGKRGVGIDEIRKTLER